MTKGFVLRIINNVKTDKFETIVWCDHISRDSYCTCLRTRPAFWSQLHIWQVLCLHLQRLQRYRANDILPTQRNKQTLPKYLQPLMLWSALQDVSRITFRFVDSYTQTETDTLKQYQLSLLRLVMIVINTIEKIIKVYWRRYEIRRSPKPKLHWEHKKYVLWNAGICHIAELLWETASPRKFSLKSGNRLPVAKNDFFKWRPSAMLNFKNFHIWSSGCRRVPNLLLCTKFHRNRVIFRSGMAI